MNVSKQLMILIFTCSFFLELPAMVQRLPQKGAREGLYAAVIVNYTNVPLKVRLRAGDGGPTTNTLIDNELLPGNRAEAKHVGAQWPLRLRIETIGGPDNIALLNKYSGQIFPMGQGILIHEDQMKYWSTIRQNSSERLITMYLVPDNFASESTLSTINLMSEGDLMLRAASEQNIGIVDKLLRDGADINYRNKLGQTALCSAIEDAVRVFSPREYDFVIQQAPVLPQFKNFSKQHLSMIEYLLSRGAKTQCSIKRDYVPLSIINYIKNFKSVCRATITTRPRY